MKKILLLTLIAWAPALISSMMPIHELHALQKTILEERLSRPIQNNRLTFELMNQAINDVYHDRRTYGTQVLVDFCAAKQAIIMANAAHIAAMDDYAFDALENPLAEFENVFAGLSLLAYRGENADMKTKAGELAQEVLDKRETFIGGIREVAQEGDASEQALEKNIALNNILLEMVAEKEKPALRQANKALSERLKVIRENKKVIHDLMDTFKEGKLTVEYLTQIGKAQAKRNGAFDEEDDLFPIDSVKGVVDELTPAQRAAICSNENAKAIRDNVALLDARPQTTVEELENELLALQVLRDCHSKRGETTQNEEIKALMHQFLPKDKVEGSIETAKKSTHIKEVKIGYRLLKALLFVNPDLNKKEKWSEPYPTLEKRFQDLEKLEQAKAKTTAAAPAQKRNSVGRVIAVLAIGAAVIGAAALVYKFFIQKPAMKKVAA